MNTMVNTPSRRPSSIFGYEKIVKDRNARASEENAARKKAEQKALLSAEEQKRLALEEEMTTAQEFINTLCESIQRNYTAMIDAGKKMRRNQDELAEKLKEEQLFHETSDELYKYVEVDESLSRKMSLRRVAYYALPVLDCFFAYFALYPIVTSKLADLDSTISGFAVVIGAILSIFVGYGISMISRLGVSSLEDDESSDSMKGLKKLAITGAVLSLPLMYIIGEVAFNGGTDWTYSGGFAFMSLIIQLLIVTGYKKQLEALTYFHTKKENEKVKAIKENDENAIRSEIQTLRSKEEGIISNFNSEYNSFTESFRNLVMARDEFMRKFGHDAKYYLNQMVIYIGDLICFRREAIPLYYEANGNVATIPLVDFPHVAGGRELFINNDFVYLDYMMQQTGTDISLSETLQAIEEQRRNTLPPLESDTIESAETVETEETTPTDAEDSNPDEEKGSDADASDNSDDDTSNDGGVIW